MFLKVTLLICLFGLILSIPTSNYGDVTIVKSGNEQAEDGSYKFYYETSDAQRREETGDFVEGYGNVPYFKVEGVFSYVAPNGQTFEVKYIADKDGFRPQQNQKPVVPSVPPIPPVPQLRSSLPEEKNKKKVYDPVPISGKTLKSLNGLNPEQNY